MTNERLVQIMYRLLRDHMTTQELCDLINETSDDPAIFSSVDIEFEARHLASSL